MKKLEWNKSLSLGVKQLDEEHQQLVALANNLVSAFRAGVAEDDLEAVFTELREYTVFHFRDEERYMQEIGFPGRGAHAARHKILKEQVKHYQRDLYKKSEVLPSEVLEFLRSWLIDHIIYEDMKISRFVRIKKQNKPVSIEGGSLD